MHVAAGRNLSWFIREGNNALVFKCIKELYLFQGAGSA
ncbi:hypothetical protein BDE27_1380 [Xenorhabdus ehlersii]|uniref:Uncharacterized protein n=1 Tax=Xenorhabdus ehlersii TaxID=290111 RepID=A0A2D0IQV1_9GAMM|nr:hypothetical protein [Xenorhabdus sp. TS4]PHM24257.1 hypothetical protein Xehl_02307 [Xenorhabdus ehlersii]RKE91175.1 hypothetical protein BDE27_1380 [Xenorhabdus ehlersii]